ncbi:MAG: Gfo/Idh/MocA family oxidoreductase [Lachnospiraceae bacterium]|jgi:predicted dehydrogenase|nr:Gfo/Idh/MocA family oxidoreductase [Lachnospiraceae bacterium]
MKNIAIIGCGDISGIYLQNLTGKFADRLNVAGIYDLVADKAKSRAKEFGIKRVYDCIDEILGDAEVDIVLNLTRPYEHYGVSVRALEAGKHVYTEKPLAASLAEGQALVALAKEKNLLIGGAPDTFLGAGIRTCRQLISDGEIGDIVGASAFMLCRGHESWHPDPAFYYQYGGGPMMDMGPYYLTAMINLAGAVKAVTGIAKASFPTRTITSAAKHGTVVKVEVPTHITGVIEFASGAVGTITTSFDVCAAEVPRIEIYGAKGTLSVPDPNTFAGPVRLYRHETGSWQEIPLQFDHSENSRGLGLYEMVCHLEDGSVHLASGELLLHVLEVMTAFNSAYEKRTFVEIESVI